MIFILMLFRNYQSVITRLSGKKSRDWWNSVLIKSVSMFSLTSTDLEFHRWHFSHFSCINICFYHWLSFHLFYIEVIHYIYVSAFCLERGCVPVVSSESSLNTTGQMHLQVEFSLALLNAIQNEKLFQTVPVQHLVWRVLALIRTWLPHKRSFVIITLTRRNQHSTHITFLFIQMPHKADSLPSAARHVAMNDLSVLQWSVVIFQLKLSYDKISYLHHQIKQAKGRNSSRSTNTCASCICFTCCSFTCLFCNTCNCQPSLGAC